MHVRAELSGRRLAVALVLLAVLPALLALAAVAYQRPDVPPGPPAYNPRSLTKDPVLTAFQARELQRSRRLSKLALLQAGPSLVAATFPEPAPSLVLAARPEPYDLVQLQQLFPEAFGATGNGGLLLRASIEVARGAHLLIDSTATPDLRLASSPAGFTTIITRGGTIDIVGTEERPLRITSWDETAGAADTEPADGRSFLLSFAGAMNITHADIGYLGFGTGTSSGAAWRGGVALPGDSDVPATGTVTSTALHHNWFGAYTFEAENMRWIGNSFVDNSAYGFDPHDFSNHFLVEGNVAHGNGRHGFIFSRACEGNILRNNIAYDNRGHGFMIDDGRSEDADYAQAARLASNNNTVVDNHAYDNDGSGVEIEGGSGNVVAGNLLERNHVGIRIKDDASVEVTGNRIADSRLYGIDVLGGASQVTVVDNTVSGGWGSVALGASGVADVSKNVLRGAATPLVIDGTAVREDSFATTVGKYFKWNPLLILWTAILAIPLVLAAKAVLSRAVNRRQVRPVPS